MRIFEGLYAGAVALAAQEDVTLEQLTKMDVQTDVTLTWNAVATAVCDDPTEPVDGLKGNKFTFTDNRTYALVRNTGASSGTVTFHTQKTVEDPAGATKDIADETVTIAAGEEELIGPFSKSLYGTPSASVAYCSWVETTPGDLEVALIKLA